MSYVDAGWAIGLGVIFLYSLSLIGRHRHLVKVVARLSDGAGDGPGDGRLAEPHGRGDGGGDSAREDGTA